MFAGNTMKYNVKSIIVSRTKKDNWDPDREEKPILVALYDVPMPHKSGKEATKILEYEVHKVVFEDLTVQFLTSGKDLLVDNLKSIEILSVNHHLVIKGEQIRNYK